MRRGALICLLTAAWTAPAAHADQTMYVVEQLVVSVASTPGGEGERVGQVKSGDRLELIERQDGEAHVRLPNGAEGWIKASYLSAEPPLAQRLSERTAQLDQLKQQVGRLQSDLAAAKAREVASAATPTAGRTGLQANTTTLANTAAPPGESSSAAAHEASVFLTSPEQPSRPLWEWVTGTSAVMLIVGFALGWRTLDVRIRRKYGGLRIY